MITVGITRIPSTSEYRVFWKEGNRYSEAKSGYTDDPEDAVNTLLSTYQTAKDRGYNIKITNADFTKGLISRYRPGFTTVSQESTVQVEDGPTYKVPPSEPPKPGTPPDVGGPPPMTGQEIREFVEKGTIPEKSVEMQRAKTMLPKFIGPPVGPPKG